MGLGSDIVGSVMVKSRISLEDARNACGRGIREDNAIAAAAVSLSVIQTLLPEGDRDGSYS